MKKKRALQPVMLLYVNGKHTDVYLLVLVCPAKKSFM